MRFSVEDAHGQLVIAENALEVKVKDTHQVTLLRADILEGSFLSSKPGKLK